MSKELEEAINFLKKMLKEYKTFGDLDNIEFEDTEKIYKQIEIVLNELERLQEENTEITFKYNALIENKLAEQKVNKVEIQSMFIEKDKIIEKLEELQKQYEIALEENSTKAFILKCQIEILKELLEGK